jgi:hypothetical protein
MVTLGVTLPACTFIKKKPVSRKAMVFEWYKPRFNSKTFTGLYRQLQGSTRRRLFKDLRFATVLFSAALGTFPLFVSPFFLLLYGISIGSSQSSSAGFVAVYLASAFGRIGFGLLADIIGLKVSV